MSLANGMHFLLYTSFLLPIACFCAVLQQNLQICYPKNETRLWEMGYDCLQFNNV